MVEPRVTNADTVIVVDFETTGMSVHKAIIPLLTTALGGGVAANTNLRNDLRQKCLETGRKLVVAEKKYCTDNAAMVAGLGYHIFNTGQTADLSLEPSAADPQTKAFVTEKRRLKKPGK